MKYFNIHNIDTQCCVIIGERSSGKKYALDNYKSNKERPIEERRIPGSLPGQTRED